MMLSNARKRGMVVVTFWIFYVMITFLYYETFMATVAKSGFIFSTIIYLLLNPAYMIILYSSFKLSKNLGKRVYKRIIGSVLLVISLDMVSSPRFALDDILVNGVSTLGNMGAITINALDKIFPHYISFHLYYVILPIGLFIFAMELVGVANFIKDMKKGNVGP